MLALFVALIHAMPVPEDREEALYQLAEMRAEIAISKALLGFAVDEDEAIRLIQELEIDDLTDKERDQRDRLIVAINNLINFCICEEYHLYKDISDLGIDNSDEDWQSDDEEFLEEYLALHKKYNETYADVEDGDIEYAMAVAAWWISLRKGQTLTYMTQNDERVRPWHFALQGFTAPKEDFPSWMIPPIEWACRCFLIVNDDLVSAKTDLSSVKADFVRLNSGLLPEKPAELNGIFKESICKCGRIFSEEHPYFEVDADDEDMLTRFVERLRKKYYG